MHIVLQHHIYSYQAVSGLYCRAQVRQLPQSWRLFPVHSFCGFFLNEVEGPKKIVITLCWILLFYKIKYTIQLRPLHTTMIFTQSLIFNCIFLPFCCKCFTLFFIWIQTLVLDKWVANTIHYFCNKHTGGTADWSVLWLLWILGQQKQTKQTCHHYVTWLLLF